MRKSFEFGADGRSFTADMAATMSEREFAWTAGISMAGRPIGNLSGMIRRETVPVGSWDEGNLMALAYFEMQESVKRRDGITW